MGNGQSVEAPRRPANRLSKPRTNSTSNLLNTAGNTTRGVSDQNNVSTQDSMLSIAAVVGDEGGRVETTHKKRMSIFRSKSTQPKIEPLQVNTGADIEFLECRPEDNWSMRGSISQSIIHHEAPDQSYHAMPNQSRPPVHTARMSLQHVPYAQQVSRLSFVAEATSPSVDGREGSQRRSTIQALQDRHLRESEPSSTTEEESLPISAGLRQRATPESEIFAPIRRRSLLQHGIATRRQSFSETDARQSLPSQLPSHNPEIDLRNYYYNPAKPNCSALASLSALGPRHEDAYLAPRTMTPNDLEYGHTGAFKLGSLRITNGTASPSPSVDRPMTSGGSEEYFGKGRGKPKAHPDMEERFQLASTWYDPSRSPWVSRAESPLRQTLERDQRPLAAQTHLPLPEFSAFNFNTECPTIAQDLAQEYQQDLMMSPFSFDYSPPRTPRLEATSKHTAMEDDLFAPEPGTPEPQESHEMRAPCSFDSEYVTKEAPAKSDSSASQDHAYKPLAKADSGYSSNVSLRSFKGKSALAAPINEAPATPPKESISRVASSASSITSSYSYVSEVTIGSKRSLPALPTADLPASYREAPPVPLKHSSGPTTGKIAQAPRTPHESSEKQWAAAQLKPQVFLVPGHSRQQSLPTLRPLKIEVLPGLSPSGSTESSNGSKNTSKWRKDKKRPLSMQPQTEPVYTVHAVPNAGKVLSVPPVPTKVLRHLEERVDGFPIATFPNTYARVTQLRRTGSKETLGTIFSVGSAEYREELTHSRLQTALPPVPATILEITTSSMETNRRNTYEPRIPAPPAPISKTEHRQPVRNVTPKQSQEMFGNHINSFVNTESSLGKLPYDNALGPSTSHPTAKERAKSMTSQLEADARQRFVRARSASQESLPAVQKRPSYGFITKGESYTSTSSSRSKPPQAHARWTNPDHRDISPRQVSVLTPQRSAPNLVDEENRCSLPSQEQVKSPPPVSMQTKRKSAPPARKAPLLPPHITPPVEQDGWKEEKNFWAERRKSAGEALKGGKSGGMQRVNYKPQVERQSEQLKGRVSWETTMGGYDHTYGSHEHNKENLQQPRRLPSDSHYQYHDQTDHEYHDSLSNDFVDYQEPEQQLPQALHRRQTSTSEMLVLDRFSGGLGYGYEPGSGLGGSAGTRNVGKMAGGERKSVGLSMQYGVDFSDVPVILQRVKFQA